jgi:hypothetical protein
VTEVFHLSLVLSITQDEICHRYVLTIELILRQSSLLHWIQESARHCGLGAMNTTVWTADGMLQSIVVFVVQTTSDNNALMTAQCLQSMVAQFVRV